MDFCRPVSVSDRVAPHTYIGLKSEHAACSVFSLSTELETPHPHILDPIVGAAHYICTLPHPRCANLLSVWMKRAAFFKAPLCWKSHFFLSAALLSVFLRAIYSLDFRYFLWFARILPAAF